MGIRKFAFQLLAMLQLPKSKLPNTGNTIFTVMTALANKHGAINLSQGFPNFDPDERLQQLVLDYMHKGFNQYSPMPGIPILRERIAEKMADVYGLSINADQEITITAGGTQAIFTIMQAFVRPGDEVILLEPCYDSYQPSVELTGGKVVSIPLLKPDFGIDWQALRSALNANTRLVCINSPNNPSGQLISASDLAQLADILRPTNTLVMSDEVYEHLIYDGESHATVLAHPELRQRSFAIYSFGKTYHNTGWKTGYCIAPKELTEEFRKVHQFNVFSANHPLQAAFAEYLRETSAYKGLPAFYQEKRDLFQEIMAYTPLRALPCRGTYFQLYDYSAVSDEPDFDFCHRLTTDYGVAAIPVSSFYSDRRDDRLIRFCFAKTSEVLEAAGERLLNLR